MVTSLASPFDVFVSQSARERAPVDTVSRTLNDAGMSVQVDQDIVIPGTNWEATLRKALIKSDAFVMIVDPGLSLAPNSTFELGAALALEKPVFIVPTTSARGVLPAFLQRYASFPISQIDHLPESIREVCQPLAEADREMLVSAYQSLGIPADRLLADPVAMDRLSDEFHRQTRRRVPTKHLASELLRMRKTKGLPRFRSDKAQAETRG